MFQPLQSPFDLSFHTSHHRFIIFHRRFISPTVVLSLSSAVIPQALSHVEAIHTQSRRRRISPVLPLAPIIVLAFAPLVPPCQGAVHSSNPRRSMHVLRARARTPFPTHTHTPQPVPALARYLPTSSPSRFSPHRTHASASAAAAAGHKSPGCVGLRRARPKSVELWDRGGLLV